MPVVPMEKPNQAEHPQPSADPQTQRRADEPAGHDADDKGVVKRERRDRRGGDMKAASGKMSGPFADADHEQHEEPGADRKSTRLNSSHLVISYAVFCLKKKKKK